MTWVVGATSVFGYGALYSDIQVTFADGITRNMIQKAYPITNFIAAGFAGSVNVGFRLLQSLVECTRLPDEVLETQAWDPVWVAVRWAPIARSVFDTAPDKEKALGAKVLLLGASPNQNAGLGARMFLVRFASPDFKPGIMGRFIMWCSIGSGAGIAEYKRWIRPHIRFASGIHRAETMNPNGWAQELAFSLTRSLSDRPQAGISRNLHAIVVRRGQVSTWTNDERIHHPDGFVEEIRMPSVAQGYEQFLQLADAAARDASCATC